MSSLPWNSNYWKFETEVGEEILVTFDVWATKYYRNVFEFSFHNYDRKHGFSDKGIVTVYEKETKRVYQYFNFYDGPKDMVRLVPTELFYE